MERRKLLRRVGAVGAATVPFAGAASASPARPLGTGDTIDVSDVSGEVPLADILDDEQLATLSAGTEATIEVEPATREIETAFFCCYDDCPGIYCVYCYDCDEPIAQ